MGALNIKDSEVAAKARRLARLKGTTITEAVAEALDESLEAAMAEVAVVREARERRVDAIVERFKSHLRPGAPSPWKVLEALHDDRGLPR